MRLQRSTQTGVVLAGQTTGTTTIHPPSGKIVYIEQDTPTLDSGAHTAKFAIHRIGKTSVVYVPDTDVSTIASAASGYCDLGGDGDGARHRTIPIDSHVGVSLLVTLSDAQAGDTTVTIHLAIEG